MTTRYRADASPAPPPPGMVGGLGGVHMNYKHGHSGGYHLGQAGDKGWRMRWESAALSQDGTWRPSNGGGGGWQPSAALSAVTLRRAHRRLGYMSTSITAERNLHRSHPGAQDFSFFSLSLFVFFDTLDAAAVKHCPDRTGPDRTGRRPRSRLANQLGASRTSRTRNVEASKGSKLRCRVAASN